MAKRGYTLVEAMVATVIAAVGVAAAAATIGKMQHAQALTIEHERMVRLAVLKFDELAAVADFNDLEGDYSDQGLDYQWSAALDTTGVDGVERLSVTVTLEKGDLTLTESSYGLIYRPTTSEATP